MPTPALAMPWTIGLLVQCSMRWLFLAILLNVQCKCNPNTG
jgi:hypothetical protein